MTSLISTSTKDVENYMDQGTKLVSKTISNLVFHLPSPRIVRLDQFNQAIAAINSELSYRCVAWNALNETDLPPSQRSPDNWAVSPSNVSTCEGVAWNPKKPVRCGWLDPSGSTYDGGVCDPNGRCYYTAVSYQVWKRWVGATCVYSIWPQGVAKEIEEHVLSIFTSSSAILGLHAFDKYVLLCIVGAPCVTTRVSQQQHVRHASRPGVFQSCYGQAGHLPAARVFGVLDPPL